MHDRRQKQFKCLGLSRFVIAFGGSVTTKHAPAKRSQDFSCQHFKMIKDNVNVSSIYP